MYEPNTVIISNGFAAMGIWVPGAIAAKHVHPDRKVVALCVDGGFPMNSQELETAKRIGARDSFAEAIVNAVREAEAIGGLGRGRSGP